ncbi:MAG: DUF11 domain-containing protein [Acidobacteria bacterium]|nr:DUF11 domain-containing protein [Acidobacteriota bacterium]
MATVSVSLLVGPGELAFGQNAVKLFGSTLVRSSTQGASWAVPVTFNSATVSLSCNTTGGPPTAVLSSTPDGTGKVLVDNFVNVSVTVGTTTSSAVNVCKGGTVDPVQGVQNCFNQTYQNAAPGMVGADMDGYTATGGIAPLDVSGFLVSGDQKIKIDLLDAGVLLTNASLYLVTSCTQGGVTGPATISGNPISSNNPSPNQLNQDYDFNSTQGQTVGFTYDLTQSQKDGRLTIADGTIPSTSDSPLDPALWQSQYATGTSFATSSCVVHKGELLNGSPACKLYTLTCQVGTGSAAAGALCPLSELKNEVFTDTFTGPAFTLPDITGPNGKTYHQGVGFLMAGEGWTGGTCVFDPASGLTDNCPQNLLTNFTSVSAASAAPAARPLAAALSITPFDVAEVDSEDDFDGTGTHPNSTFISVAQVPEDLTTVTVQGAHPGGWVNSHTVKVGLVSEPPVLPNTVPNYQKFVASPIKSITYGVSAANMVPPTKFAVTGDVTLANPAGCPTPAIQASVFAPPSQTLTVAADGMYALHYFAQDCAGTEELQFTPVGSGGWATSFYTVPVNVDTVAPVVASGPVFSVAPTTINGTPNSFTLNQQVNVSYSCTDDRAGVAVCGAKSYGAPGTLNTGTLTYPLDTSSTGKKTLTVTVTDAAGNAGTPVSVTYNVVAAGSADLAIVQFAKRQVKSGARLHYDMLVVNFGPKTADAVVIKDVIPAGTTFVSAGYESISCALFGGCSEPPQATSCSVSGSTVVCNAGQLKPLSLFSLDGIGVKIVVRVNAAAGAVLVNTATVESSNSDPNPGNNTSTRKTVVK